MNVAVHSDDAGYTVLEIDAPDTPGFLYELSHALWPSGYRIARVVAETVGRRARDLVYLTDAKGHPVADEERLRELSAATVLVKRFTHMLPLAPDPARAMTHFGSFIRELFRHPHWAEDVASLDSPPVLAGLSRLLGVSDYLWEDVLRMQFADLVGVLSDVHATERPKGRDELSRELDRALVGASDSDSLREHLNAFKDREMFRIDLRHIQGRSQSPIEFGAELTEPAEVVIAAATRLAYDRLALRCGRPVDKDGREVPLVVCALGKCGGRELGYASDIELMFVYSTHGPRDSDSGAAVAGEHIGATEFYERLAAEVLGLVVARRQGIFQIDLRLRPYGSSGSMAVSLDALRRYYSADGPAWPYERQALTRLRPIYGNEVLAAQIVSARDAYVYGPQPFDVAAMRAMRERQLRHLVVGGTLNAKFSPGGLVDVEYLVQGLQIRHGHTRPELRVTNTPAAIDALGEAGLITTEQRRDLREAYVFLRRLIDALRIVRGDARDLTVPTDPLDLATLGRYLDHDADVRELRRKTARHMESVRALAEKLLGDR